MIIDLILDRKDGKEYNAKRFYNDIMICYCSFPDIALPIADALDSGKEEDVKRELKKYIKEQGYNSNIVEYINSVDWLPVE